MFLLVNRSDSDSDIPLAVLRISLQEHGRVEKQQKNLLKKVDRLLKVNGCERVEVPQDGNCFFHAVLHQQKSFDTIALLRKEVSAHVSKHKEVYLPYCVGISSKGFRKHAKEINKPGYWDNDLGDLPLAMANMLRRKIVIFSGNKFNALSVVPSIKPKSPLVDEAPILLAYVAHDGKEHYDRVIKKKSGGEH